MVLLYLEIGESKISGSPAVAGAIFYLEHSTMPFKLPYLFAFLHRHTRTCLDCGFLTIKGRELTQAERFMLSTRGRSAVMPANTEQTGCSKNLWVDYELTYFGDSEDGVFEEIERPRRKCPGFFWHEHGFTPAQHLEHQEQRRREQLQWKIAILGFFGGVLGALIGSFLRDLPHWIASVWRWVERL